MVRNSAIALSSTNLREQGQFGYGKLLQVQHTVYGKAQLMGMGLCTN